MNLINEEQIITSVPIKTLIITPTYNEKNNIVELINRIMTINKKMILNDISIDILVIDDNSPDGTGEIIEKLRRDCFHRVATLDRNDTNIEVIHRPKKLGLATAYIEGFKFALEKNYDFIICMDADLSHNPDYLPLFIENFKEYDLIIGSRYVKDGEIIGWPLHRKLLSYLGNLYARNIISIPIKDFTSGFIGFKKNILRNIDFKKINSEGYGFLIEIKYLTYKMGYKIYEIPIVFTDRIAGKSKISRKIIFEAIFLCLKLKIDRGN